MRPRPPLMGPPGPGSLLAPPSAQLARQRGPQEGWGLWAAPWGLELEEGVTQAPKHNNAAWESGPLRWPGSVGWPFMTNNPAVLGAPRADKGATVAVTLGSGKYGVTALDPRGTECTRARRDRPGPVELDSSIAVEVRPNIGGAEQTHNPGGLVKPPDSMGSHTAIGAAMPPLR